jgi:hypothetical protein
VADTRVQLKIEDWVRQCWMPPKYGGQFICKGLRLSSGGEFEFDAVSVDGSIAANISTSSAKTASGKRAVGKLQKIRADMLFLLLADVQRRIVVLTEKDMYDLCVREKEAGRVPPEIEFAHAQIPDDLANQLRQARKRASREVSPQS